MENVRLRFPDGTEERYPMHRPVPGEDIELHGVIYEVTGVRHCIDGERAGQILVRLETAAKPTMPPPPTGG